MNFKVSASVAVLAAASVCGLASAQDTSDSEEIIVTAQKRAQRL